jgi:hypothetical protein
MYKYLKKSFNISQENYRKNKIKLLSKYVFLSCQGWINPIGNANFNGFYSNFEIFSSKTRENGSVIFGYIVKHMLNNNQQFFFTKP